MVNKTSLYNKTLLITGASRGIGLAVAKRAAQDGARIAVVGKTTEENSKLPGTIYTAVDEITALGGSAIALPCDIRNEEQVQQAVQLTVESFGGIDILVNNASAIDLRNIDAIDMKRFDLMQNVNARGTYMVSKYCLPYLRKSSNPHILTMSPPLDMQSKWFSPHLAYTMAKFGMSMVTLGLANELAKDGIAVNSLWPETTIATAAVGNVLGGEKLMRMSRTTAIVADAAYEILTKPSRECTGNFFLDVDILRQAGIDSFDQYAVDSAAPLALDLFLTSPVTDKVIDISKKLA